MSYRNSRCEMLSCPFRSIVVMQNSMYCLEQQISGVALTLKILEPKKSAILIFCRPFSNIEAKQNASKNLDNSTNMCNIKQDEGFITPCSFNEKQKYDRQFAGIGNICKVEITNRYICIHDARKILTVKNQIKHTKCNIFVNLLKRSGYLRSKKVKNRYISWKLL